MSYIPITPFGRSMSVELIEHHRSTTKAMPETGVNKYEILRKLTSARAKFGLSDRALNVLQALLSFHPETELNANGKPLTVFPSNASICERLNGMACSTMRRHLAVLVDTGLIVRRDSPNGKRYVKRYSGAPQAFGFDLTPLVTRLDEISELARDAREVIEEMDRLKRSVSLMRRDLAGLAELGADMHPERAIWDAFSDAALLAARLMRRKLSLAELNTLKGELASHLAEAKAAFQIEDTTKTSTSDVQNEQHYLNSNKDICRLNETAKKPAEHLARKTKCYEIEKDQSNVPIQIVRALCREIWNYTNTSLTHWAQLVEAAQKVGPMMGLHKSVWDETVDAMGQVEAAIVVACMLDRFAEIEIPNGYLKALSRKARAGRFSSGPMVMALARKEVA